VERAPGTNLIGGSVDAKAGLDDVEKRKLFSLPGLELRPLGGVSSKYNIMEWLVLPPFATTF
jgi:hypothetical protein